MLFVIFFKSISICSNLIISLSFLLFDEIINPLNNIIFFSSIIPLLAIIVDEVSVSLDTEIFCKIFELSCKKMFVISFSNLSSTIKVSPLKESLNC